MKFFIWDKKIIEVTKPEYNMWFLLKAPLLMLPDYFIEADGDTYGIETMYNGCFISSDNMLPFMIFYYQDVYRITETGINKEEGKTKIEYFATPTEMEVRYHELKEHLEKNITGARN